MDARPERERLLRLVIDLILRDGVFDLTLSGIARSVGSNNRMLLYYFGSKEDLVDEAAVRAIERFPGLRDLFVRMAEPGDLEQRLLRSWDELSAPENLPYLRLYFQRFGFAMREPADWGTFTERTGTEWVSYVRDILRAEGFGETDSLVGATQIVALWRGLQMSLLVGVDPQRLAETYRLGVRGMLAQSERRLAR
jgi:AcrR family transcriptional regulator